MLHSSLRLSLLGLLLLPRLGLADDQGLNIGYQLEASMASTYVFRGVPQYLGSADGSSQNTASVRLDHLGPGSLSFGVWNATAVSRFGAQVGTALELDLSAGYTFDLGVATASFGYIAYLYPEHMEGAPVDGAHELTLSASVPTPWLTAQATAYVELVRQQGAYLNVGATRDLQLGPVVATPALTAGLCAYNRYLGAELPASLHLNDVTASLQLKLPLSAELYVAARASYSYRGTPHALMESVAADPERAFGVVALAVGLAR